MNQQARWSASVPAERLFHLQLESENYPARRRDLRVACKSVDQLRLLRIPTNAALSGNSLLQVA